MIDRAGLEAYISDMYGVAAEYPWADSPENAVARFSSVWVPAYLLAMGISSVACDF